MALSLDPARWRLLKARLLVFTGLFAICLTTSSNYVLNEILDAPYDVFHPGKASRLRTKDVPHLDVISEAINNPADAGMVVPYPNAGNHYFITTKALCRVPGANAASEVLQLIGTRALSGWDLLDFVRNMFGQGPLEQTDPHQQHETGVWMAEFTANYHNHQCRCDAEDNWNHACRNHRKTHRPKQYFEV